IFRDAGAVVIESVPGRRPSTGEILAAIEETHAQEVVVLPNDPDSVGVASAAASAAEEQGDVRVVVVPTRAQVQGIAAIAVLEPLLTGGGELVTLVTGRDGDDLAERCQAWVEAHHPGVDVLVYDGGQARYPLLVAVE